MLRILLATSLVYLAFPFCSAHAQDSSRVRIIGLWQGLTYSQLYGAGVENENVKLVGASAAAMGAQLMMTPKFGVSALVGMDFKGAKQITTTEEAFGIGSEELKARHRYQYATLPLLLSYHGGDGKYVLMAGGYAGYLLQQYSVYKKTDVTPRITARRYANGMDRLDYGVMAAATINVGSTERIAYGLGLAASVGLKGLDDPFLWSGGPVKHALFSVALLVHPIITI